MARHYSNVSKTMSLQAPINAVAVTATVDDASGLPTLYPFNVALDYGAVNVEIVSVTNVATNTLTIVRGQEDTAASSHSTGAVVVHPFTALDAQDSQDHIAASANIHGIGGGSSVVGTATAQTLTNKIISGAANTLTNIPAGSVVGTFTNILVGQSNAAVPALTITPNGAPSTDIISSPYWKQDQNGINRFIAKSAAADVVRVYSNDGVTLRAAINETGLLTCIGVTSTGAVSATTIAASGLITANAGITANAAITANGLVTMAAGGSVSVGQTFTVNGTTALNGVVNFGAASSVTFDNGFTVPVGDTAQISGALTVVSGGTVNFNSGSTLHANSAIDRDSATARLLMDASETVLTASANPTGAANSYNDLAGCTFTFTVPAGRTATVDVTGVLNILGAAATTASFELVSVLDGVFNALNPIITTLTSADYAIAKRWIYTGVAAGSHTIKLQYRNVNGNATVTLLGGTSRTSQMVLVYW